MEVFSEAGSSVSRIVPGDQGRTVPVAKVSKALSF